MVCCSHHKLELKHLESLLSISVTLFLCQTSYCLQGMQQHWCSIWASLQSVFCELPHLLYASSCQLASPEPFKCSSHAGDTSHIGTRTRSPAVRCSSHKWSVSLSCRQVARWLSWSPCNPDKCLALPLCLAPGRTYRFDTFLLIMYKSIFVLIQQCIHRLHSPLLLAISSTTSILLPLLIRISCRGFF